MAKRKAKRQAAQPKPDNAPNPFREQHGAFVRPTSLAYRAVTPLETLASTKDASGKPKLSQRQYTALCHYRDKYLACLSSPNRDSLDISPRTGGDGPLVRRLRESSELAWLERELGALVSITRFVAGEDNSLSAWAIERHGAKETATGRIEAKTQALKIALMDIRFAGDRLANAIER